MKNQKIATIKTTIVKLFERWLLVTYPFHQLTKTEQGVLSQLLYYHYIYKKKISDEIMLWKMVFDYDTKMKVKEYLNNMTDSMLQNTLTKLRKKNIISKNNRVTPAYIPDLEQNSVNFKVIFNFNIIDNAQ